MGFVYEPENGLDGEPHQADCQGEDQGIGNGPEERAPLEEPEPELERAEFDAQDKNNCAPENDNGDSDGVNIGSDLGEIGLFEHFYSNLEDTPLPGV